MILPQLANALDLKITRSFFEDVEVVAEEPRNPDGLNPTRLTLLRFFAAVLGIIFYALTFC